MKAEDPVQVAYDAILRLRSHLSRSKPDVVRALNAAQSAALALEDVLERQKSQQPRRGRRSPAGQGREVENKVPDPVLTARAVVIAMEHKLDLRWIRARNRDPHVVIARIEIARALRAGGASLPTIGAVLRRDHSTIMYLLRRESGVCACNHTL